MDITAQEILIERRSPCFAGLPLLPVGCGARS